MSPESLRTGCPQGEVSKVRILLKVLKWAGIVFGGLVGLIVVLLVAVYFIGGARVNKTYDIQVKPITIPDDEEAIARGEHLVSTVGLCLECHGEKLEGTMISDDPLFGRIAASNLISGKGGVGGRFGDIEFVRAIRHGVRPDGTSLIIMPSNLFSQISGPDLGAIIAYLKSVPPVDNELPATAAGPGVRAA